MRFQDAARDARAIVYAGIQADALVAHVAELLAGANRAQLLLARAVMNGERTEPEPWRAMFPALFGPQDGPEVSGGPAGADAEAVRSEAILAASLEVARRGEQVRSQFRGAIVESLTQELLSRRTSDVRRERRVLFDGVTASVHPYDVTVEAADVPEVYDCKWGARGINADVLNQLDDARRNAAAEDRALLAALVVFDARRSCLVRLARQTAPRSGIGLVSLETIGQLAARRPAVMR